MSMALEAIQRRPRQIGYSMPAKAYSSGADVLAEAQRIQTTMRPVEVVRVKLARPPEPEPLIEIPPAVKRRHHDYLFVHPTRYKLSGPRWNAVEASYIIAEVCAKHQVTLNEIKGQNRSKRVVPARHEAYFRLSEELGYSQPMIGRAMGGKEHTGVLHGIRRHRERMGVAGL